MKRKITALAAVMCAASMLMTGCAAKELSNEYVTVNAYKGVKIEPVEASAKVTDAEVEAQIESNLSEFAETVEITDRAAQEGDIANINYVGTKDGVAFEGGTYDNEDGYNLELGSGAFIEGFEEGVVGHKIGETFDLNLTFPENYKNEELAGQDVVFTVTLNSLSVKEIPELTDEFVKENLSTESETVEAYKAELKKEMQETNDESYRSSLRDAAWNAVLENTTVNEYPEEELQKYMDMIRSEYETMAGYYNLEFDEFLETYLGVDEETFNTQVEEVAQNQVKSDLVRDLLAENVKGIDKSEKAYENVYAEYAEYYSYDDVETFLADMEEAGNKETLDNLVLLRLVQDWTADNCKQVKTTEK